MKPTIPHSQGPEGPNPDGPAPEIRSELDALAPGLNAMLDRAATAPLPGTGVDEQKQLEAAILARIQVQEPKGLSGEGPLRPRNRIHRLRSWSAAAAVVAAVLFAGWYALDRSGQGPSGPNPDAAACQSFDCQLRTLDDQQLSALVHQVVLEAPSDGLLEAAAAEVSWTMSAEVWQESADALLEDLTEEELGTLLNL
jgi:hypothetical protein